MHHGRATTKSSEWTKSDVSPQTLKGFHVEGETLDDRTASRARPNALELIVSILTSIYLYTHSLHPSILIIHIDINNGPFATKALALGILFGPRNGRSPDGRALK